MATTPSALLNRAKAADDLQGLLKQGLGGVLLAVATGVISGILSVTAVVTKPLDAVAGALADLAIALFGSPARILIASADATAQSLLGPFNVGPATFALGVASVLGGLWVVGQYRDEEETGSLLPGLPFDPPLIGESEEGES